MQRPHRGPARVARFAAALGIGALAIAGCSPARPRITAPVATPPPAASSPRAALQRLQWEWQARDTSCYSGLFTSDYAFEFGPADSLGNAYRTYGWTREDEAISTGHLFLGGSATEPPAADIALIFNGMPADAPDLRPGKSPAVHRQIAAYATLTITRTDGTGYQVNGMGLFYLVRGDSAALTPAMVAAGMRRDSTRWYIERWEDETGTFAAPSRPATVTPAAAQPAHMVTWGDIKALYRI